MVVVVKLCQPCQERERERKKADVTNAQWYTSIVEFTFRPYRVKGVPPLDINNFYGSNVGQCLIIFWLKLMELLEKSGENMIRFGLEPLIIKSEHDTNYFSKRVLLLEHFIVLILTKVFILISRPLSNHHTPPIEVKGGFTFFPSPPFRFSGLESRRLHSRRVMSNFIKCHGKFNYALLRVPSRFGNFYLLPTFYPFPRFLFSLLF